MSPIDIQPRPNEEAPPVSGEKPWLGLASFTEETRAFFYGRDDEVAELGRRVQRKLLTVLFGQSGLGKTSMLRAGLVPRLRPEGYCPIYVRIDHSIGSPAPAEQIKAAVRHAAAAVGTWSKPESARAGESLWEFFHHRDDVLSDAGGRVLTPLLIFDQFEEVFTLAQTDDTGRARARGFLEQLADLVENRAPVALEDDEASAERFDFARADYRVLIALREDYLAHLEGLREAMPSVTQNRVRLTRMAGGPALEAVVRPGAGLVSAEVARQIVRFVSGARDLAAAEVEPSLLSLVCRELNEVRLAKREPEISASLLAGSRDSILGEFYERSLADQPAGVRHFIEDVLLTDSGYRESVAEERVRKAFAEARAPAAVQQLVDRRLLRIEERLDVRRVELTHDVLCGVVKASRDSRHEREATEAAEQRAAETEAREAATRRALRRARTVAAACSVLALVALGSAAFGYWNLRRARAAQVAAQASAQRAREAEASALRTRQLAETARREAEQLLSYLLEEFQRKLFDTGQLALYEQLARRTVDYYERLPGELVVDSTERNRTLALSSLGAVLNRQNRTDDATALIAQAEQILRRRVAAGDHSVATAKELSMVLTSQEELYSNQSRPGDALRVMEESVALLRPLMANPANRAELQTQFAFGLMALGWAQRPADPAAAERSFVESAEYLVAAGGADPKNEDTAALYSIVLKGQCFAAQERRDFDRARSLIEQAIALQTAILQQSPARIPMLQERAGASNALAVILDNLGRIREAFAATDRAGQDYEVYLQLVPTDGKVRQFTLGNQGYSSVLLGRLGQLTEARTRLRVCLADGRKRQISSALAGQLAGNATFLALSYAEVRDSVGVAEAMADLQHYLGLSFKDTPAGSVVAILGNEWPGLVRLTVDFGVGVAPATVHENAQAVLARLRGLRPDDAASRGMRNFMLEQAYGAVARSGLDLGRFAEAEAAATELSGLLRGDLTQQSLENEGLRHLLAQAEGLRAQALIGEGRRAEARAIIDPLVVQARESAAAAPEDESRRLDLADLLLTQAAVQEPAAVDERRSQTSFDEAEALLEGLSSELKDTTTVRRMAARLAAERAKLAGKR